MTVTDTYLEAAESFADLVDRLPADLSGPGLGDWDLRALVGHTSRAMITVSQYVGRPAEQVDLDSPAAYLGGLREAVNSQDVTERGRAAGADLGEDAPAAVRRILDAVVGDLAGTRADQLVTTIGGGMRLGDYLPTRTFELVVHGLDVAHAAGIDWTPPPDALRETALLAAEVAVRRGEGAAFLRSVTGRDDGGYSIV